MKLSTEERLAIIERRNKRVELDKAWEISITRRILVTIATFVVIGLYLSWLGVNRPWLNAIVPVLAFIISTFVVQQAKSAWINNHK